MTSERGKIVETRNVLILNSFLTGDYRVRVNSSPTFGRLGAVGNGNRNGIDPNLPPATTNTSNQRGSKINFNIVIRLSRISYCH